MKTPMKPPKKSSNADRGKSLERAIAQWFAHYSARGIHWHKNQARALRSGMIVEGESFDFEIFHNGKLYAFDAKTCHAAQWNIATNAKLKQLKSLTDLAAHGAEAFFLVYFVNVRELVRFDVPLPDKKSLTPDDGVILKNLDILGIL